MLFDRSSPQAGFTLFEVMVSLAVLSAVIAIGATAIGPPSPFLRAKAQAAALIRQAGEVRREAIVSGTRQTWLPDATTCDPGVLSSFTFFPDGTAAGPELCLFNTTLSVHRLTGLLFESQP